MAFGSFFSLLLALCSSSDVAVYRTSELVGDFCELWYVKHLFPEIVGPKLW